MKMLKKQTIGKIQLYLGIILFVITLVGSILIVQSALSLFVDAVDNETTNWGDIQNKLTADSPEHTLIMGFVIGDILTQGLIMKVGGFIFGACVLILIVLSLILILQGLANQSKK